MFTPESSKSTMNRIGRSLKIGAMLVLMGLLMVATERPILLSPPAVRNAAERASHPGRTSRAAPAAQQTSGPAAAGTLTAAHFPSRHPAPNAPAEARPPLLLRLTLRGPAAA